MAFPVHSPGRLCPFPRDTCLPHWCVLCMTLVTARGVSCPSNTFSFSLISSTLSCNYFLLVLLKSGLLSNCQFNFSNFFLKTAACWLMSILKVTSFTVWLTPVCQGAFDVVTIWVNLNIRSGQIKYKIIWSVGHSFTCSCVNKLRIPMYLIDMFDNHFKGYCAWFDLNMMFGLTQIVTTSKAPDRQVSIKLWNLSL